MYARMGACTRRIAGASVGTKAVPVFPPTESTTLLGTDPPRTHLYPTPSL
jgi:hypothetical protein